MARMRTASVTGAAVAAAFGLALIVSAQAPDSAPQLKILSPGEDSYVSGARRFSAPASSPPKPRRP